MSFKCLWCDKTFNTKSAKKRHKKSQECTGDDDYSDANAQRELLDIIGEDLPDGAYFAMAEEMGVSFP